MKSKFLQLAKSDLAHACYETIYGAIGGALLPFITGDTTFTKTNLYSAFTVGGLACLRKLGALLLTNSQGLFATPEPQK